MDLSHALGALAVRDHDSVVGEVEMADAEGGDLVGAEPRERQGRNQGASCSPTALALAVQPDRRRWSALDSQSYRLPREVLEVAQLADIPSQLEGLGA